MKIAIIADTHEHMRLLRKVTDYLNSIHIDLLIHCGDWDMPFTMRALATANFPIKSVLGNGDPDIQKFLYQLQNLPILKNVKMDMQQEMLDFVFDNRRIAVFHGDDDQVTNVVIDSQMFDLLCIGHNHIYSIEKKGKTLVVNPGSFIGYKEESGIEPIRMVIYDTIDSSTETIDIEAL